MKRRPWLWLAGMVIAAASQLSAQDDGEPPVGLGNYQAVEFDRLSDRNVSRRGAEVLKMDSAAWVHGESDHFIFHFEKGFLCPQFASAAELFYGRIKQDLGITEDSYERKAHIFVFLGTNSWRQFSAKIHLEKWTGSFQSGNELYVQAPANQRLDRAPYLPHEITHLVVHRFLGDTPLWLNEGLAEYEGRRQRVFYMRTRLSGRTVVLTPRHIPREELISLDELTGRVDYPEAEAQLQTFYIESELLVRYLITECGGVDLFRRFVSLQSRGLTFLSALHEVYRTKFPGEELFEKSFSAYAVQSNKLD
jgi:hypothetical protein